MNFGLALGSDCIVALPLPTADAAVTRHARPSDEPWNATTLEAALRTILGDAPAARVRLHVGLLPPFAGLRFIDLPPLQPEDRARVLRRDADRHFTGREVRVIAADRPRDGGGRTRVVSGRADLLEQFDAAAQRIGVRRVSLHSAFDAWAAAAPERDVLIQHDGSYIRLRTSTDGAVVLRRAPGCDGAWLEYLCEGADRGPITMIGAVPEAAAFLESRGHTVSVIDGDAAEIAARYASVASGPELIADTVHARVAKHTRRRARVLLAAAIALFVLAGGVDYWALGHRLAGLRERRAAIRDQLAPVLAVRDSLEALRARLELLDGVTPTGPRFTDVVFDLAMHLPEDAYLTQFAGEADSVLVRGTSANAARAAEALRNAQGLSSTQFVGAIRRELREGAQPLEHFTLVLRPR